MIVCSSRRARFASISCPQNARSSACATVATRTGRRPRSARDARRASGRRERRAGSRSGRRRARGSSAAARRRIGLAARIVTVPSGDCHARASSGAVDREHGGEEPVAERPRRVAREPCGQCERVRPAWLDREFDRQRSARAPSGVARMPSSAARSSTSSAWSPRPPGGACGPRRGTPLRRAPPALLLEDAHRFGVRVVGDRGVADRREPVCERGERNAAVGRRSSSPTSSSASRARRDRCFGVAVQRRDACALRRDLEALLRRRVAPSSCPPGRDAPRPRPDPRARA